MTNKKKTTSPVPDRVKLVGPAPGRVLAGVVFLCAIGLLATAQLSEDWMAVAGCVLVLTSGGLILEYSGRSVAEKHPHPLYERGRLPSDSPRLKVVSVVLTLVLLVLITSITVRPGQNVSPFPFFLAAGYLFLVLPQALARRAIRNYDENHAAEPENDGEVKAVRKRKGKKRKKH